MSTNGPDLSVFLSVADHGDLDAHDTVVIWCRRFAVAFGAADLTDASG